MSELKEEGLVLYGEAEGEVQEADAMIQSGRRTLKEARARQHQVRLSRQYYRTVVAEVPTMIGVVSTCQRPRPQEIKYVFGVEKLIALPTALGKPGRRWPKPSMWKKRLCLLH